MYVYVYVCVFLFLCTCVYIHMCIYTCVCIFNYVLCVYVKLESRNWKLTARSTISGTCIGALMTSRRGTSRELRVKDEKGDLVADSHSIMTRWKNYFSQLLNVHGAKDVRQEEIHRAEPQVPEPSVFEVELAIEKLKNHNHQVLIKSQRN